MEARGAGFETSYPSYGCQAVIAPAATATDIFTISGSASKTILVMEVMCSGTQTTGGNVNMFLIKRSTLNTGGTSSAAPGVAFDSANAAATAVVLAYSANPAALGTAVGTLTIAVQLMPTASGGGLFNLGEPAALHRQHAPLEPIVLRGVNELLALNLAGVTVAGGSFRCGLKWCEL